MWDRLLKPWPRSDHPGLGLLEVCWNGCPLVSVWLRAGALVAAVMLSLSGCGGSRAGAPSTAGPCEDRLMARRRPDTPAPCLRRATRDQPRKIATATAGTLTVVRTRPLCGSHRQSAGHSRWPAGVLRDGDRRRCRRGRPGRCWWSNHHSGSAAADIWCTSTPARAPVRSLRRPWWPNGRHREATFIWVSDVDHGAPEPNARASGTIDQVPGILRMLEMVHNEHGRTLARPLRPAANAWPIADV